MEYNNIYAVIQCYTYYSHRLMSSGFIAKLKKENGQYVIEKLLSKDRLYKDKILQEENGIGFTIYNKLISFPADSVENAFNSKENLSFNWFEIAYPNDFVLTYKLIYDNSDDKICLVNSISGIKGVLDVYGHRE